MTLKPPVKCTCHVHQTTSLQSYNRDAKLNRKVRRSSLKHAAEVRTRLAAEVNPKERAYLESVIVCAEWTAWLCLEILRETKKDGSQ